MFSQITMEHVVQIPPKFFGLPKEESVYKILSREYSGILDKELGFIIAICDILEIGPGKIIHGHGGTFHPVKFTILTYKPLVHEVVEGEVVEIAEFGVFIRLGPQDGMCHLSQITDEQMQYDSAAMRFIGKETGKYIELGDFVRARITAVSSGGGGARAGKIGLTMRQPFLGKIEWINEELDEIYNPKPEEPASEGEEEETD